MSKLRLFILAALLAAQNAFGFAVATPSPWATEAAVEILKRGGNATDAMVAASFALNVAQPYAMGIGGGGFFLVTTNGKTDFWDHRESGPASAHEKMFLGPNGKPLEHYPDRVTGPNPVGVPGTPAGLFEAHKKRGKLPWKTLLEPAIRLAKQGFPISPKFEEVLAEEWPRISAFPATAAVFGNGEGGHLRAGHVLRQPLLAQTLEKIAAGGAAAFYTGELSRSWLSEAGKLGVKITPEDLAAYRVRASKPVEFKIFGLRALTAPPPSASGLMVAGSLRYLERYYREHDAPAPGSAARMIVTAEALRYFQELRNTNLADPPHGTLDPAKFLGSPEEKKAWAEIDKRVQNRLDHIQTKFTRLPSEPLKGHTAHLSIADDHGMAVAYTTTIEEWFGSGMVVTGHGFLLNNELSDFAGEPGHPNSPAPGKRPRSNMSPTLLFAGDKAVGVVGCAGGGRIPTAIVELLENYYIHKMTAREAIAFPRFHPDGDTLQLDRSVPDSVAAQLKSAGYDVKVDPVGGVAQALLRRAPKDAWEVASEPRSDGLGFAWEKGGGR